MSDWIELHPDQFPSDYKMRMIQAYPVISQMDPDELYYATGDDMDDAFRLILSNRHLRRTHEMYLEDSDA